MHNIAKYLTSYFYQGYNLYQKDLLKEKQYSHLHPLQPYHFWKLKLNNDYIYKNNNDIQGKKIDFNAESMELMKLNNRMCIKLYIYYRFIII